MCGIFGFAGSPDTAAARAHGRRARAPRPRRRRLPRTAAGEPRPPAPEHHRPRRWPPAAGQRGRDRLARLQRRDLQLPRAARRARGRRATRSARAATARSSCTPTRSGARPARRASTACGPSPSPTCARRRATSSWCSTATTSASSRSTTPARRSRGRLLFASEIKALLQDPELVGAAGRPDGLRVPAARLARPPRRDVLRAASTTCCRRPGWRCRWRRRRQRRGAGAAPLRSASRPTGTPQLASDGDADPAAFRRLLPRQRRAAPRRARCPSAPASPAASTPRPSSAS